MLVSYIDDQGINVCIERQLCCHHINGELQLFAFNSRCPRKPQNVWREDRECRPDHHRGALAAASRVSRIG